MFTSDGSLVDKNMGLRNWTSQIRIELDEVGRRKFLLNLIFHSTINLPLVLLS